MEGCCSENKNSCCCGNKVKATQVSTELSYQDIIGSWKARWGINRMNYKVAPGLYSVGDPNGSSPVLVSANYKMSFDALRKQLSGIHAWILVLDTKGINVWCAAGKGTFGTQELISRIDKAGLKQVVEHMSVIVPQLGAVGVSAHAVYKRAGFKVIYGPVRAKDIPEFLKNGMKADKKMRTVKFTFMDRAVLTPMEIVRSIKTALIIFGIMFLLNLIGISQFSNIDVLAYLGAVLVGGVLVPMLLPWIPGRPFALKGWLMGLIWAISVIAINGGFSSNNYGLMTVVAYLLILPSVSAYYAMNFTGASTYTSLSGVLKEMKIAVPLIIITISLGVILLLIGYIL